MLAATQKADDLKDSLINELENNWVKNWTFAGHKIINWEEQAGRIMLELDDGTQLIISLEELSGNRRLCLGCGILKGGWPNKWKHVDIEGEGFTYICADCAQIERDMNEETE